MYLLAVASQPPRASAWYRRSFLFTAAGQSRILTGFPFHFRLACRKTVVAVRLAQENPR